MCGLFHRGPRNKHGHSTICGGTQTLQLWETNLAFFFLASVVVKATTILHYWMLNKICKCLSFVFLSKHSTATQNFNTQVTIHSHSKQQNVKHREQQFTLAFDHLGHNRALVHYLYTWSILLKN